MRLGETVAFRVLGPIEAVVDGRRVDLGPPKRRLVLALLLLECGRPVAVDKLVDLTWEEPPPSARRVVFAHVARLRKALAGAAKHGVALVTEPSGYAMRVEPDRVDVHLFRQLVESARTTADPAARAKLLRDALDLWRGAPLEDPEIGSGPHRLCRGLEDLRLNALEGRIDADLAAGMHATLVGELSSLVAEHRLRERLAGQLMLALYRSGNTSGALEAYRRSRAAVATELGLDPGPGLNDLHDAILRRDPSLAAPSPTGTDVVRLPGPPASGGSATTVGRLIEAPAQLPPAASGFTGRTAQIGQLDAWLDEAEQDGHGALVATISGTAGVGKTALAVHWAWRVADRFPDGQIYLDLRGFDPSGSAMSTAEAVRALLDAFLVPAERIPAGVEAQVGRYRSLLAGKRVLVVLDNAATAEQTRPLLPGAPGCAAVVTSRNQLISLVANGARQVALDVFTADEARKLLSAHLGGERLMAEARAVDTIIALCAGLPLALAIVAARAATRPAFPLAALAGEMTADPERLDALDGGDASTRIRTAFSWSYQRLDDGSARLFRLIGLHCGPDVSAAAVASLAGIPPDQVRPALAELIRAHLLEERVPGRYATHDLLRVYARELADLLDYDDERCAARHRVLDHYLHTCYATSLLLNPHRQPITLAVVHSGVTPENLTGRAEALAWFTAERAVLIAAVEWAAEARLPGHAWQLAWTYTPFLERRGHWEDLAAVQRVALRAARQAGDRAGQAHAHYGLGRAYARLARFDGAGTHFGHARALFDELDDPVRAARTYLAMAGVLDQQDRAGASLDQAGRALDLARSSGNRALIANALNAVGWYHARIGDGANALAYCRQALTVQEELGDLNGQATTLDSLGYAHHLLGRHDEAMDCYRSAIALYRSLGDRYYEADTLVHLGDAHDVVGAVEAARAAWRHALQILEQLQHTEADRVRAKLAYPR
jgi:DNA-binding SARP family transcriptional activator/tetratricopeptide (TPR) repeat protein